ncbi:hypothetical protein GCM10007862_33940 [Dyella lipolytica]|nr:hypothetical protein GCM10007862_33940 [Dyella lipolytica]
MRLLVGDAEQAVRRMGQQALALGGIEPTQGIVSVLKEGVARDVEQQIARAKRTCLFGDPVAVIALFGNAIEYQAESGESV